MSKTKLPWFIKRPPEAITVACATVDINDHFGHEVLCVTEWANGEGFDLHIAPDKGPEIRTPLTWQEWDALKRAVRAMRAHEKQVDDRA